MKTEPDKIFAHKIVNPEATRTEPDEKIRENLSSSGEEKGELLPENVIEERSSKTSYFWWRNAQPYTYD